MSKIESYEDLMVWQKAHELVLNIYEITKTFPANEQFGLTIQLRRCIVSVPANISEGSNRYHLKEFIQFLNVAKGSIGES
ncbi:MAG: four helix bundle protein, partial [Eubacteriales bacterium]